MGREIFLVRRLSALVKNKNGKLRPKIIEEEFPLYQTPTEIAMEAVKSGRYYWAYTNWLKSSGILDVSGYNEHLQKISDFSKEPGVIDTDWGIT